jgi:hypothetical protein
LIAVADLTEVILELLCHTSKEDLERIAIVPRFLSGVQVLFFEFFHIVIRVK